MNKLVLGTAVTAGLVSAGLGLAGVAAAAPVAPTAPSPVSNAPASAGAAPAPVPVVYQPVDASEGFYGVRRGSVPTASTADLSQVPIANQLPVIGVTPLPAHSTDQAGDESTDESAAEVPSTDGSTADGSRSEEPTTDTGTDDSTATTDQ